MRAAWKALASQALLDLPKRYVFGVLQQSDVSYGLLQGRKSADSEGRLSRRWHGGYDSDVRANDVAFSLHCNLMTVLGLTQIILFEKGGQKVGLVKRNLLHQRES